MNGSLRVKRVAGSGNGSTKLQGRGIPAVSMTRLGIVRDKAEWKVNNGYNHMLISIPVLRMNTGTMCIYARNNYSTVGVIEQKDMVNSGVRGRNKVNLRLEVYSKVS